VVGLVPTRRATRETCAREGHKYVNLLYVLPGDRDETNAG
jgi:hypothetical protein